MDSVRDKYESQRVSRQSDAFSDGKFRTRRVTITDSEYRYSRDDSTSQSSDKLSSQWEDLMRKFSQDVRSNQPHCEMMFCSEDVKCESRPLRQFPTGSKYEGTWDMLGMTGFGTYTFPDGAVYEGEFEDNDFHGDGELRYLSGVVVRGKWNRGELLSSTIVFPDGVHYDGKHWTYCKAPDRRFSLEITGGLKPGSAEAKTAELPSKEIPPGYYDVGDGLFDPVTKFIYKYNDLTSIIRDTTRPMQEWIIKNCRTNPYLERGPKPELYEKITEAKIKPDDVPSPTCLSELTLSCGPSCDTLSPSAIWKKQDTQSRCTFKYDPSQANIAMSRPDIKPIVSLLPIKHLHNEVDK